MADRNLRLKLTLDDSKYNAGMKRSSVLTRKFANSVTGSFTGITAGINGTIRSMNKANKATTSAIAGISTVYAGQYVASIVEAIAAEREHIQTVLEQKSAQRDKAKAMKEAAEKELSLLDVSKKKLIESKAQFEVNGRLSEFSSAMTKLMERETVVTERLTLAKQELTKTSGNTGLLGTMSMLYTSFGGMNLVITAAVATLASLVTYFSNANDKALKLASTLNHVEAGFKYLSKAELIYNQHKQVEATYEQAEKLAKLTKELELAKKGNLDFIDTVKVFGKMMWRMDATPLSDLIDDLTREAGVIQAGLDKSAQLVTKFGDAIGGAETDTKSLTKSLERLLPPLEKQEMQYKKNEKVLKDSLTAQLITIEQYHEKVARLAADNQLKMAQLQAKAVVSPAQEAIGKVDPLQNIENEHQQKLSLLEKYKQMELLTEQRYNELIKDENEKYQDSLINEMTKRDRELHQNIGAILSSSSELADGFAGIMEQFAGKSSGAYKSMFVLSKAFAIADAVIKLKMAIMQVMASPADLEPAKKLANVAAITAAGAGIIRSISSVGMSHDGFDKIPKSGTWMLEKNERVVGKHLNADLTEFLAKNKSGAGTVINVPVSVGSDSGMKEDDAQNLSEKIRIAVLNVMSNERRPGGVLNSY